MTKLPPDSPPPSDADIERARAGLHELSQEYSRMPSSVADRLDAALADLPELAAPDTSGTRTVPAKLPWWRRRFGMATAALAAVVVVGVGGVVTSQLLTDSQSQNSDGAASQRQSAGNDDKSNDKKSTGDSPGINSAPDHKGLPKYRVSYSGNDYTADDLADAAKQKSGGSADDIDGSLKSLASDATQRDKCLSNVAKQYQGKLSIVDFGAFEKEPAMIAVFESDGKADEVVAVGAGCNATQTDELGSGNR